LGWLLFVAFGGMFGGMFGVSLGPASGTAGFGLFFSFDNRPARFGTACRLVAAGTGGAGVPFAGHQNGSSE